MARINVLRSPRADPEGCQYLFSPRRSTAASLFSPPNRDELPAATAHRRSSAPARRESTSRYAGSMGAATANRRPSTRTRASNDSHWVARLACEPCRRGSTAERPPKGPAVPCLSARAIELKGRVTNKSSAKPPAMPRRHRPASRRASAADPRSASHAELLPEEDQALTSNEVDAMFHTLFDQIATGEHQLEEEERWKDPAVKPATDAAAELMAAASEDEREELQEFDDMLTRIRTNFATLTSMKQHSHRSRPSTPPSTPRKGSGRRASQMRGPIVWE